MAYGRKYTLSYKRRSGSTTTIDILEDGYAGSVTTLTGDKDVLTIKYDGDIENIYQPTRGSGAVINILGTPLTLTELFTTNPQKYVIKIYNGATGVNLIWQGFVSACVYGEDYSTSQLTPISIIANDGMSLLENIPYKVSADGDSYTGFDYLYTVLDNIFSKLGITFTYMRMNSDLKIADYCTNFFLYLWINEENYYDEEGVPMNCREVLDTILQPLGLTMTFQGDTIYFIDPINLDQTGYGMIFNTAPIYGAYETESALGGYLDISNNDIDWYETGVHLDIVQPFNELDIKYEPYNFTDSKYDFGGTYKNSNGTEIDNASLGAIKIVADYTGYYVNRWTSTTMHNWDTFGFGAIANRFEAIQKVQTGSTTSEGEIDYYIKQDVGDAGYFSYTFPFSNIKQDESLRINVSMEVYVNTKHDSNLWSDNASKTVNEIQIPIRFKVGNQYYDGGNTWNTNSGNTVTLIVREPDTQHLQKYVKDGWWLWKHYDLLEIDDSEIQDRWTNAYVTVDMGQSAAEDLISGDCTIIIARDLDLLSVTPYAAETSIKNVLIKDVEIEAVKTNNIPIGNDTILFNAKLYNNDNLKKSTLNITLKNGIGNYGASKAAFATQAQVIAGTNITGLARSGSSTYYDTAKLVAQNYISEYNSPRYKLTGRLDVRTNLLDTRHKLIKDSTYLSTKAFYINNLSYNDADEYMECDMIEITSTRESL